MKKVRDMEMNLNDKENIETEQLVASADSSSVNAVSEPEEHIEDSIVESMNESKHKPGVGSFIAACAGILVTLTGCGIYTIKKVRE